MLLLSNISYDVSQVKHVQKIFQNDKTLNKSDK